jgi:hypothetical protein
VLKDRTTDEFREGMLVGFALALVIIGPFGFFALIYPYPLDISRLQSAFMFYTALGIVGFIVAIAGQKKKKKTQTQQVLNLKG